MTEKFDFHDIRKCQRYGTRQKNLIVIENYNFFLLLKISSNSPDSFTASLTATNLKLRSREHEILKFRGYNDCNNDNWKNITKHILQNVKRLQRGVYE